jgi:beta-lactamase regulating signal transducer with metallopeptidase domain
MMMILWWFAQNTITIAVMTVFAVLACRLFRHRPAVQHVLWAVILLKFITPPIVSWPWSAEFVVQSIRSMVAARTELDRPTPQDGSEVAISSVWGETEEDDAALDPDRPGRAPSSDTVLPAPLPAGFAEVRTRINLAQFAVGMLFALWVAGAIFCTARQMRRIARHAALVRSGRTAPAELTHEVAATAMRIGLSSPRTVIARGITSPFVWFVGPLRLVWPEAMSSREDVARSRGVIAHELAHMLRRDHWWAWLELLVGLVCWWNPLYWFVRKQMRSTAEMACDAIALCACPANRKQYAELLLELASDPRIGVSAPVLGVSTGGASSFERRLSMILSDRVSERLSGWGLVAAGLLAIAAVPGWSLAQQDSRRPETVPDTENAIGLATKLADDVAQSVPPELRLDTKPASDDPSDATTTAERLTRLEAAIQRLTRLVERNGDAERQIGQSNRRQPDGEIANRLYYRALLDTDAKIPPSRKDANVPVVIRSRDRTYILAVIEDRAFLTALNTEGRQIWLSHLPRPVPIHGEGVKWGLTEPAGDKQVVVTGRRPNESHQWVFDRDTGKLLTATKSGSPEAGELSGQLLRRMGTLSQSERLDRLEKAVEDLRKRLDQRSSSDASLRRE